MRVLSAPLDEQPPADAGHCDRNSLIPGTLDHPKCQSLGFNLGAAAAGNERVRSTRRAPRATRRPAARAEGRDFDMQLTFDLNSAVLTPQDMENTQAMAKLMQDSALAGMHFRIEGYTDQSGSFAGNLALSQKRADSTKDYLLAQGIDPARLESKGFGPVLAQPDAPNDRANRRVVVRRIYH